MDSVPRCAAHGLNPNPITMYVATLLINDLTITCWGDDLETIARIHIAGDVTAETFNPEFYEQIKAEWQANATYQPF